MTSIDEPRSFRPRSNGGGRAMKFDPPPEDPTLGDVLKATYDLHGCLEEHRREDKKEHTANGKRTNKVEKRLAAVEKQVAGIAAVVGVNDKGEVIRKTPMLMGRLEFISTFGGAITVVVVAVQIVIHLWP